jgi:hypothetical protein
MMKTTSSYEAPNDFLGGCGQTHKAPRTKLRTSWLKPKDEEMPLESLMLKPSKKPVDFMGGSSSKGLDVYKDNKPMEDNTETTAYSSCGDLDLSYGAISNNAAEPEAEKPVVPTEESTPPPEKEEESAESTSMACAQDEYLPGCEPKPIKRWTPPKKQEEKPVKHTSLAYAQDEYLPGCEPAPIKRWTPPKKDPSEEAKRMSSTWDQPTDFLGGCAPKPIRRWSKPTN